MIREVKNKEIVLLIAMIVLSGIVFALNAGIQGFWNDELFSIGVVREGRSFSELMYTYVYEETTNPPLYDVILFFIYRIVPKKEAWLLAVNAVFWGVGTFLIAKLAKDVTESLLSFFIVLCLSAINVFIINNGVWELRSYTLLYMLAAVVLYLYFKTKREEKAENLICLGVFMVLLAFTHYFGDILIFCYGLADLILFIKKKVSLKCLIPYIMCTITMGPYLLLTIGKSPEVASDFWIDPPTLYAVADTFVTIVGNKYSLLLSAGFLGVMLFSIIKTGEKKESGDVVLISLFVSGMVCVLVFVYSRFVNPAASLWTARYFFAIIPSVYCAVAVSGGSFTDNILILSKKNTVNQRVLDCCILVLLIAAQISGSIANLRLLFTDDTVLAPDNINVRKAVEYIIDDKAEKEKIIITKMKGNYLEGLKDFYLKDSGIPTDSLEELNETLIKEKAVYVLCPHGNIPEIDIPGVLMTEYYGGRLRILTI